MMPATSERTVYDAQSLNEAFDARRADMWFRLQPARQLLSDTSRAKFVSLSRRTSAEGNLCGVRFFEPRWFFGKREVAEVIVSNDRGDREGFPPLSDRTGLQAVFSQWLPDLQGYSVAVWRRGHFPKVVFDSGNGGDLGQNAEAAAAAFCGIAEQAKILMENRRLSRDFPVEWTGEHWRDAFAREFIQPRAQAIAMAFFAIGIVAPFSLVAGAAAPKRLVFLIATTLIFGSLLLSAWIPGLAAQPLSRKMRWFITITALVFISVPWLMHLRWL